MFSFQKLKMLDSPGNFSKAGFERKNPNADSDRDATYKKQHNKNLST